MKEHTRQIVELLGGFALLLVYWYLFNWALHGVVSLLSDENRIQLCALIFSILSTAFAILE